MNACLPGQQKGRAICPASSFAHAGGSQDFTRVLRQRVQMLSRMDSPPKKIRCLLMLGLKVRDFFGALRSQRPPCLWRMCRPNIVVFAQTSQAPLAMRQCPFRGRIEAPC